MSIWRTAPVEQQPSIELFRWYFIKVTNKDEGKTAISYHIIGNEGSNGRVSSFITDFNKETMTVTTQSGRKYILKGKQHKDRDALYVLSHFQHDGIEFIPVTDMENQVLGVSWQ